MTLPQQGGEKEVGGAGRRKKIDKNLNLFKGIETKVLANTNTLKI